LTRGRGAAHFRSAAGHASIGPWAFNLFASKRWAIWPSTGHRADASDEVNSWSGKNLDIGLYRPLDEDNASTSIWVPRTLAFTSETFLLSFSLPNFHFHAVTAYDILRSRGVPLGKRDYEGRLRTRSA
jgi:hypothetical protein